MEYIQKIDYINKVNDRFINARNHGTQGDNWWYPKQNVIAYNVKMHCLYIDKEEITKLLSERQKEFYNIDNVIENSYQFQLEISGQSLVDEIENLAGVKTSNFAGRSGGWYEVEYQNNIDLYNIDTATYEEIEETYQNAKQLEELENKVNNIIIERKLSLEKYLSSKEYIKDIINDLHSDDEIAEIYKQQAQAIINKLK